MDNRFFPLPFQFDSVKLAADLAACEAQLWAMHFNEKDYDGAWTGIALRSATGHAEDINAIAGQAFQDTPLLAQCPYFRAILDTLEFEKETVRLLALAPGSVIKEHRDRGLGYEHGCFRLHIPIATDDRVSFIVDNTCLPMEAGQCWYANFDLPHSVLHEGSTKRVHLVIDGIRNNWTDRLFEEIGYDFELEARQKEYDEATKAQMIEHLRAMNTDAARAIIAEMTAKRVPSSGHVAINGSNPAEASLADGWIPIDLQNSDKDVSVKWLYVGEKAFSEPFFDETISAAKRLKQNKAYPNRSSSLEHLIEMAQNTDCIAPTAFIFHVSRCGSTLLSQLLCTDSRNIVLSEVPVLDTILRLPYRDSSINQETIDQAFLATLRLLGRKRTGVEQHLFIKTDGWHTLFYDTYRRLFPQTPFLLLYRTPDEVLLSQQKQRGIHSIPAALEPALTGIPDDPSKAFDLDGYFLQLLERVFSHYLSIKAGDKNSFLVNYNSGQGGMIRAVEKAIGLEFSAETYLKMEHRGQFHGKKPYETFETEKSTALDPDLIRQVMALYEQLDAG